MKDKNSLLLLHFQVLSVTVHRKVFAYCCRAAKLLYIFPFLNNNSPVFSQVIKTLIITLSYKDTKVVIDVFH